MVKVLASAFSAYMLFPITIYLFFIVATLGNSIISGFFMTLVVVIMCSSGFFVLTIAKCVTQKLSVVLDIGLLVSINLVVFYFSESSDRPPKYSVEDNTEIYWHAIPEFDFAQLDWVVLVSVPSIFLYALFWFFNRVIK